MSKIIYLNQKLLFDPRLSNVLAGYNYNWTRFQGITQLNPGLDGNYIRAGKNTLPLKNNLVDRLSFQMPKYDPSFKMSFSEVTDLRLTQLRQTCYNKRWLVLWSGGIDSTVIVASILKNLSPADRANIDIACNRVSIYEHPQFYYRYIEPNFVNIVDSNFLKFNKDLFEKYYIIDGEPADQLYGGFASRGMINGNAILKDWRTDPDELIDMFSSRVNLQFAEWYNQTIKENIESIDVPVENYYDFCWWIFFNASWMSILLRPLQFQTSSSVESLKSYLDNFIPWFDTVEYQQWSLTNRLGTKYGINIGERKLASKQYIYKFDHDEYYFRFKTKMESVSRKSSNYNGYFCILDDLTRLTLDRDLEQILQLLPEHINL
jgi:hypothetical protein